MPRRGMTCNLREALTVTDTDFIENLTYDELNVGQSARLIRTLTG